MLLGRCAEAPQEGTLQPGLFLSSGSWPLPLARTPAHAGPESHSIMVQAQDQGHLQGWH